MAGEEKTQGMAIATYEHKGKRYVVWEIPEKPDVNTIVVGRIVEELGIAYELPEDNILDEGGRTEDVIRLGTEGQFVRFEEISDEEKKKVLERR